MHMISTDVQAPEPKILTDSEKLDMRNWTFQTFHTKHIVSGGIRAQNIGLNNLSLSFLQHMLSSK